MPYEIMGKFFILSINATSGCAQDASQALCTVKGILGSISDVLSHADTKISPNLMTTLLINTIDHANTLKFLGTGKEITIIGQVDTSHQSFHPIYVKKIMALEKMPT